jgi:guanylate kinase
MRPTEVEGKDYFFITPKEFESWMKQDAFLEHAVVFENRYGTPKGPVEDALLSGRDVLFDIDWQGTQQMKERAREDLVSIFVLPPSHAELERRLKTRAQDSDDVVAQRMAKAADEISHWPEYDYVIVNRDIDRALMQIKSILEAERARRARLIGVGEFVAGLTH